MTGTVQGNDGRGRDEGDNWTATGISGRLVYTHRKCRAFRAVSE